MAIDTNLAAYYPFDGDGTDSSVNGNNLTLVGGTHQSDYVDLDGTDDYLYITDGFSGIGGQTTMTLYVKFKRDTIGLQHFLIGVGDHDTGEWKRIGFRVQSDNKIRADFGDEPNTDARTFITTDTFTDTASDHILIATYDAGTIKIYLDDVDKAGSTSGGHTGAVAQPTTHGRYGCNSFDTGPVINGSFFNGFIYDLAIWNRKLTAAEMTQINDDDKLIIPPPSVSTGQKRIPSFPTHPTIK